MGGYYGLVVLASVALLMTTGQCETDCGGTNGHPGVEGSPGRDGVPGLKGEKGQPAAVDNSPVDTPILELLKGDMGSRGLQGIMGPKGYRGDLGAAGSPGRPGRPGPEGRDVGSGQHSPLQRRSAFSVQRTDISYPRVEKTVTFDNAVVNIPDVFNPATGHFTCKTPGVYYFSFHSMAKVSMCLRIASEALARKVGFCDYNNRNTDHVLSGGVVLQLSVGQKVWLESFRDLQTDNELRDSREKLIIFNGFLLFANSE